MSDVMPAKKKGVADFIFLVDGTGSMHKCMRALKDNISVFLEGLNDAQGALHDWRGKVVVYRDVDADGSGWMENNPFVQNDPVSIRSQVQTLEAKGGGDEPESLLDALHMIATMGHTEKGAVTLDPMKWRYPSDAGRVVILFTDASFHSRIKYKPEVAGGTINDVFAAMTNARIILHFFAPDNEDYNRLSELPKSEFNALDEPPVQSLATLSGDRDKFQKIMLALVKTISSSHEPIVL